MQQVSTQFGELDEGQRNTVRAIAEAVRRPCKTDAPPQIKAELESRLISIGARGPLLVDQSTRIRVKMALNSVLISVQTGNVGRFYADILKMSAMHHDIPDFAACLVVLTKGQAHRSAHSGTGNLVTYERSVPELKLYSRFLPIPAVIIGVDNHV